MPQQFYYPNADGTPVPPVDYDAMWGVAYYKGKINDLVEKWRCTDNRLALEWGAFILAEFRRFCEFHKIDFDDMLMRDVKLALSCAIIALQPGG